MTLEIERAAGIGFCFGVRRAIDILKRTVRLQGPVQTLGAVVHNEQVLERLEMTGISIAHNLDEVKGRFVAISSHGVSPETEAAIRLRGLEIIDTTCPFVRRAQVAARRLAGSDFHVVVYGDASHPEVKGILGWAENKGMALLDAAKLAEADNLPRRLGILSQTTQIPDQYTRFTQQVIGSRLVRDSEIRIIDTICHDLRKRQSASLELARRTDLVLVIGGRSSANTRRLFEVCSEVTETHQIEQARDISLSWLKEKHRVGVTSGASTADIEIEEVVSMLRSC
jgi:4-hydroxy-3-methylbut-2-en-1-yl diphosphate reductase